MTKLTTVEFPLHANLNPIQTQYGHVSDDFKTRQEHVAQERANGLKRLTDEMNKGFRTVLHKEEFTDGKTTWLRFFLLQNEDSDYDYDIATYNGDVSTILSEGYLSDDWEYIGKSEKGTQTFLIFRRLRNT